MRKDLWREWLSQCVTGFGMLDLLFVLMILSLAMVAVTPGIHSYWQRQQLTRVTWDLFSLLQLAQTLAQTQHRAVVLCGSADGVQCDGQWSTGLLMFYGRHGGVVDPTTIIRFYNPAFASVHIHWRGFLSHDYVRFDAHGMGRALSGRFHLTQTSGQHHRCLVMNRIGRIRVEQTC